MGDPSAMVSFYPNIPEAQPPVTCGEFVFLMDRSGSMQCPMSQEDRSQLRIDAAKVKPAPSFSWSHAQVRMNLMLKLGSTGNSGSVPRLTDPAANTTTPKLALEYGDLEVGRGEGAHPRVRLAGSACGRVSLTVSLCSLPSGNADFTAEEFACRLLFQCLWIWIFL